MRAEVDEKKCNGCEVCAIICPEVFRMKNNGGLHDVAEVHCDPVPPDAEHFCIDARDCCQPGAIVVSRRTNVTPLPMVSM